MIFKFRSYSSSLRLMTYFLPVISFVFTAIGVSLAGHPIDVFSANYGFLVLGVCVVWATICEQHQLFTIESMLRERTSLLVSGWATLATYAIIGMVLYFTGQSNAQRLYLAGTA